MKVIGIVGGVASGKSTVAREFARLGAVVLNADEAAHRALDEPEVKAALVDRWGTSILGPEGNLDRDAISRKVFGTESPAAPNTERTFLESLIHPRVRCELERQMVALDQAGTDVVVLDVPLLVEVGWESMCDHVYFVDAPLDTRLERASKRGWSEEDLRNREAAQAPLARKRAAADQVVQNSEDIERLRQNVAEVWQTLHSH